MKPLTLPLRHFLLVVVSFLAVTGIFLTFSSNTLSFNDSDIREPGGVFTIPYSDDPVTLDGRCGDPEYSQAQFGNIIYPSGFQGLVRLQHDEDNLPIAFSGYIWIVTMAKSR